MTFLTEFVKIIWKYMCFFFSEKIFAYDGSPAAQLKWSLWSKVNYLKTTNLGNRKREISVFFKRIYHSYGPYFLCILIQYMCNIICLFPFYCRPGFSKVSNSRFVLTALLTSIFCFSSKVLWLSNNENQSRSA